MANRQKRARRPLAKMVLRLPDLEQSKNAVLNSLAAPSSRESTARTESCSSTRGCRMTSVDITGQYITSAMELSSST
jgi:hypothetical protein